MCVRGLVVLALALSFASCESMPGQAPPPEPAAIRAPLPERAAKVEASVDDGVHSVRLAGFEEVQAPQRTPVWCWAACAEMILRYDGEATTQEEIAERVHGFEADGELKVNTASRYEVFLALSPEAPRTPFEAVWTGFGDALEREVDALAAANEQGGAEAAEAAAPSSVEVKWSGDQAAQGALDRVQPPTGVPIAELLQGDPAVAGLRDAPEDAAGHVYVIVGATYRERKGMSWQQMIDAGKEVGSVFGWEDELDGLPGEEVLTRFDGGRYRLESVELVDPFAASKEEMRLTLPAKDFARRVDFVTTRTGAHESLTLWARVAELEVE